MRLQFAPLWFRPNLPWFRPNRFGQNPGAAPERVSDERLRRAFRYAERPDDVSKSAAPVDRYVALARSCSLALDEAGREEEGADEERVEDTLVDQQL